MKPYLAYLHSNGEEATTRREIDLISRRSFIRRSSLFLPLSFFAGSVLTRTAKASVIINRTIAAASQNAVSMANSTWARPVTMPAAWNHIRVGMRMHMTNTGITLVSNPIFAMGFCSGTTNQYGTPTTTHFIGAAFDRATYGWQTPAISYATPTGVARKRVGTTNTDSAGSLTSAANGVFMAGAATNTADRGIYFIDVLKGSPNYTFHYPFHTDNSSTNTCGDVSSINFLTYMGYLNPVPTEPGYFTGGTTDQTVAVNEGVDGTLNAVNLYWNRADATCEVCDIAVAVLA